ncbi:MAG: proline dehydrogenase family protein, partial [Cyanobacteria bacterium J06639_1]
MVALNVDYEPQTQEIGRRLLDATQARSSVLARMREQLRRDDRLLAWAMENPGLRVQLFRLIDCLPALHDKTDIARHLQDYLSAPGVELPGALKSLLEFPQPDSVPGQLAATTLTKAVETLARKYISGETLPQALKTLQQLRQHKQAFTLDVLGEAVISEVEAQQYLDRYLDLMAQLTDAAKQWKSVPEIDRAGDRELPRVQVSVKLSAFDSQFDPLDAEGTKTRVSDRVRLLLRRAREVGAAIHFDMEQYAYKDLTLAILKELLLEEEFRDRDDIGLTLQAYLPDSGDDLSDLIGWAKQRSTPVTVRLVKGAYWDRETITASQNHWPHPVYPTKAGTDANFERLTQLLLENHRYLYAAIGSHNARSQARAIAIAKALNVPPRAIELQVLYGMADKLAKALTTEGYRVRVYCPFGELVPGMAYLIRRLLENTANTSFLRQSVSDVSAETLLAPPDISAEPPAPETFGDRAPDTDYSQLEARTAAKRALQTVRQQLGKDYRPLIDG